MSRTTALIDLHYAWSKDREPEAVRRIIERAYDTGLSKGIQLAPEARAIIAAFLECAPPKCDCGAPATRSFNRRGVVGDEVFRCDVCRPPANVRIAILREAPLVRRALKYLADVGADASVGVVAGSTPSEKGTSL